MEYGEKDFVRYFNAATDVLSAMNGQEFREETRGYVNGLLPETCELARHCAGALSELLEKITIVKELPEIARAGIGFDEQALSRFSREVGEAMGNLAEGAQKLSSQHSKVS